jgi:hypothetical protein
MLKINVGLSRKLSKDFQSTGFSLNLEGEITAPVSDPEAVIMNGGQKGQRWAAWSA